MQSLKDYGHVHIKNQIQDFTGVGPPTTTIINHIAKVNVLAHYVNVLLPWVLTAAHCKICNFSGDAPENLIISKEKKETPCHSQKGLRRHGNYT